jgi:DNA-binding Lrp family transcriptional regulator
MIAENHPNVLAKTGFAGNAFRVLLRETRNKRWKIARMELDSIDLAILTALQADGRMSNAALAEAIGLSPSACSRRLDHLEKSGTIRGYHARVSNQALGYTMTAIVHISLSGQFQKTLREFEEAVKRCPNVIVCYLMSGEYDYILRVAAKDLADYERIHRDWLSALPHVVKINSSFALREVIDRPNVGVDPALV